MKYGGLTLGQIEAIVNKLGGMEGVQKFLSGAQLHIINCNAPPFTPADWSVEYHKKGGQFIFDPTNIKLHLSPNQQNGKSIKGNDLRRELENEPVLNANVLDYLLEHKELIPEEWKGKYVFFWGTIYRSSNGHLYVRYLYFDNGRWYWHCIWLDSDWIGFSPAALRTEDPHGTSY